MRKLNRLTMTLALLLTAVGGAWAGETPLLTIESEDYTSFTSGSKTFDDKVTITFSNSVTNTGNAAGWYSTGDPSLLTVAGINGYTITSCKFYTQNGDAANGYTVEGESPSVYLSEWNVYTDANQSVNLGTFGIKKIEVYGYKSEITEWSLKPDETGKTWTLAEMPASNIELQVEYEPTKVSLAANDNAMGTVEVAGESKVEWTADTWKGWTYNDKEHTVDDITMTISKEASVYEYTVEGTYKNSLSFFVDKWDNTSTVTFSTTGDPFSRIEFTMLDNYEADWNPNIMPTDNWTIEGKSAKWEGEATKSLILQSCTTEVSKITFFKGAAIPDGVTVNTDGTFTVAKTATVTLKATPKEGYKFLYWEDDPNNTNPVREVTIESGMADKTYKAVFAEITYNVTFVEGTNLNEWSATPNTEVKKGDKVDINYTGSKKVIGVKVEKKATVDPANAYLTWDADQKKLVATEIPAEATKVENSNSYVEWSGTYVVEGNVTISGQITLSGNVNLIIKDGATLTAQGGIRGYNNNLYIYGQANQTGQLVVDKSDDDAITSMKTLEVHSAKLTATSSKKDRGGFYYAGTINVYGGSVDATAANGYGISLRPDGSINIYGGEVKAVGKGTGSYSYGITAGNTATVTVNGGKLWAENADKKAINTSSITLTKGAGFTGKIEYSSDNSTWSETADANAKYVRAGY